MKRYYLIVIAIAWTLTLPILADDEVPALCINNSKEEYQVELSEILSIKYTDTDMVINFKDGTKQIVSLDEIQVMEFGRMVTAIRNLTTQYKSNGAYTITDLRGNLVVKGNTKSSDEISVPIKKGLYLLTIGKRTSKILVK